MNQSHPYASIALGTLLMLGAFAQAQEETTAEPLELTRLREQFQTRVDQEMIPWREKYKKELQKLEDRFIQERRLKEALVVKAEREANGGLSSRPADGGGSTIADLPKTPADLQKYLKDTVWMVYSADDKKHENLIAVYHFYDSDDVIIISTKTEKMKWACKSSKDILIPYPSGDISFGFDVANSTATAEHMGKKFTATFVGRPNKSK